VEHVVFLMLFQSLIFIAAIVAIILSFIDSNHATNLLIFVAIFGSLYFIVCLKIYYKQGLFKTIIKSILIRFAQIIFLVLCSAFVLGISFLLY
jgi:predicted neutral ceramidase superfamily lipid hydrolase